MTADREKQRHPVAGEIEARDPQSLSGDDERLTRALQMSQVGAWDLDLVDHTARRTLEHDLIFGYTSLLPVWTYEVFLEHVLPSDRADVERSFGGAIANQADWDFECRIRRADGEVRWIWATGQHQKDEAGQPRRMLGIVQDITERKHTEEELRESEARLQLALGAARAGTWEWDVVTGENRWSDELWDLYGLDRVGLEASYDSWLASVRPEDRDRLEGALAESSRRGAEIAFEWQVNDDRSPGRWLMSRGQPVKDEEGEVVRYRGIVVDITDRKHAEDAILDLNLELETRVQERTEALTAVNRELLKATLAKSEFLAAMSHELRTPLNSIIGFSGVLAAGLAGPVNPEQAQQLGMVEASGKHLLSLIDDVLDLSRIESGRSTTALEEFDVPALVSEVLAMIRPLADAKGLGLKSQFGPGTDALRSDPNHVRQILINLLGNAVKFTESGGVSLDISVDGGQMAFAVADTGIGIRADDLPHIMEDFYQAVSPTDAKHQGTGLGLAISSRLADAMGGAIDVSSEFGVGSTFTLRIPCDVDLASRSSDAANGTCDGERPAPRGVDR